MAALAARAGPQVRGASTGDADLRRPQRQIEYAPAKGELDLPFMTEGIFFKTLERHAARDAHDVPEKLLEHSGDLQQLRATDVHDVERELIVVERELIAPTALRLPADALDTLATGQAVTLRPLVRGPRD